MLPSPTPASPTPGRHFPAACGSPCRGCRRRQRPSLMLALLALTLPGLHVLRVPGDLPPEDGAAGAHGVSHRGNALQGQARWCQGHGLGGEVAPLPGVASATSPLKPASLTLRRVTLSADQGLSWHLGQASFAVPDCRALACRLCGADWACPCSAPPAPSSSCRRRTCRVT